MTAINVSRIDQTCFPDLFMPGQPDVVLKYSQTLDGQIATNSGDARWISSEVERDYCHRLRAASDAVIVGSGTIKTDDPLLTVRRISGPTPVRVVLDRRLQVSPQAHLFSDAGPVVIVCGRTADTDREQALARAGGRVLRLPTIKPTAAETVDALKKCGLTRLLVEGGQRILTAFIKSGLPMTVAVSIAPRLIGTGLAALGDLETRTIHDGLELAQPQLFSMGTDALIFGTLNI